MKRRLPLPIVFLALAVSPWLALSPGAPSLSAGAQETPSLDLAREPPEKIVRVEACGECHVSAYEVWKKTPHATGFKTLHRTERAETISKKMGLRLMKRDSLCLSCHYTPVVQSGQLRAISGVSCESCHGAGKDWINIHNNYGEGYDHATETAEHRRERIAKSREAGMRRPSDLYPTVASCFGCHTVPNERLVNVGGHSTGTVGFELVEWSQGQIRHNFLQSFLTGDGTANAERSTEDKRALYVAGRALDLEYSLRGAAEAAEDGVYARAMTRRVKVALLEIRKILQRTPHPELSKMPEIVAGAKVVPGNRQALTEAADAVGEATRRFLGSYQVEALAALDPLILGIAEPEPADDLLAETGGSGGEQDGGGPGPPGDIGPGGPGAGDTGGAVAASGTSGDPGRPAVGAFKRRIRPASKHRTLGPGACSGCHEKSNKWWFGDPHSASANPFFERRTENLQIARLYGLSTGKMILGNQVCMDCHGTVISGNESFEVFDGVSCESCHGSAKDFLEPHKEGEKALGLQRPGYVNALKLGMEKLKDPTVRARRCSGCHYITEPRLLSAGHPSGKDFDYLAGMGKIRHWEQDSTNDGALRQAFTTALEARGGVPDVELARLPSAAASQLAQEARSKSPSLARATGSRWNRPRPASASGVPPGTAGAEGPPPARSVGPLDLPPFPQIDADTAIEEVLLFLKQRLELLQGAIRRGEGGR